MASPGAEGSSASLVMPARLSATFCVNLFIGEVLYNALTSLSGNSQDRATTGYIGNGTGTT
eukprot:4041358-Ditylum_brightwellii.AAC.1